MRKIISLIVTLVVATVGVSFALLNDQSVHVDLYLRDVELPLSVLMVATLLAGGVLGVLVSLFALLRRHRECARIERRLRESENELRELRRLPLKDPA
jgi:lipopolysaccharide assembly protein A